MQGLGIDERFARETTDGTAGTYRVLTDGLGSTVALANSSGVEQTSYAYDPYGNTSVTNTVSGATSDNP